MSTPAAPFQPPARLLLGPGPSAVDPRVLTASSLTLLGHLDPAFLQVMDDVAAMLRQVFRTQNPCTLAVPGTGTSGMEAAVMNVAEAGDRVVVGVAGYFGARMAEMVRRAGATPIVVEAAWGRPVPAEAIAAALAGVDGPVKAVGIVHAETSTGVLQPLDEIIQLAHERGALAIVDAVTSLGGIPLDVDALGIDVCYSGTQKCIGSPPGLAPITVSPRALAVIEKRRTPPATFYMDLRLLQGYWRDRAYHHTSPIQSLYALREALRLLLEEGLEPRWERHRRVHDQLARGAGGLGLEFLVEAAHRLPVLNTLRVPAAVDDRTVRQRLLQEHGIEIGGGLGPLAGSVWRVGLMGYSAREENVARLLTALRIILGAPRMSKPPRRG
jgi:alanine-glyoxylate transaminase/serine-glyoxylate transaminase/serine-pyruvate transaminase